MVTSFTSPASTLAIHTLYVGVSSRACAPLADTSFQSITPRSTIESQKRIVFSVEPEFTLSSLILQPVGKNQFSTISSAPCHFSCASHSLRKKAAGDCALSRWRLPGRSRPILGYIRFGSPSNQAPGLPDPSRAYPAAPPAAPRG